MAYMSQNRKKELSPGIKAALKKYGVKASIAVRHHSTLVVNIRSGTIDFWNERSDDHLTDRDHIQVNTYWIKDHWTGNARDFLLELKAAMSVGNHDRSDAMVDHFDVGWYTNINIGQWNKPYELEAT